MKLDCMEDKKVNNYTNFDDLMLQIKAVRKVMITTGTTKGLNHAETIEYSQKLDLLINQFQFQSK